MALLPFLGGAEILHLSGASAIAGFPLKHLEAELAARLAPYQHAKAYKQWQRHPLILPDVNTIIDLHIRGMCRPEAANYAARCQGIPYLGGQPEFVGGLWTGFVKDWWDLAAQLHISFPEPAAYAAMRLRGWLTEEEYLATMKRLGASPSGWLGTAPLHLHRLSPTEILDGYIRGLFGGDFPTDEIQKAGGDWDQLQRLAGLKYDFPSPEIAIALFNRGIITTEEEFLTILKRNRLSPTTWGWFQELRKGIPGISDLLRMGSRLLFTPEIAGRYGLYDGFQERSRPYFKQLGLDYGLGFQIPVDGVQREATLPDLYWGATREILPLGSAYLAYQRLRPEVIAEYQHEVPNLRPFTLEDLRLHMRVAGYPPPMQDFLIALSHPPIGIRQIRASIQFGGWDLARTKQAFRTLGFSELDSLGQAETLIAQNEYRQDAWKRSLADSTRKRTVSMIEGLYDDGTIDRAFAMRQLSDAGLPGELSTQLLDIVDFSLERRLVRAAIAETGRDFLSGELSLGDAETQLRRIGVQDSRIRNYLGAWTIRRNRRRKQAETGKITAWLAAGLLSYGEARARLLNLGWTDPDATLLLAEATGKLAKRQAAEFKAGQTAQRQQARELERLSRDADAQSRKLRSEANRVAPRSVLLGWMKDGIITEDEFRAMMRERGFPDELIDDYIRDSKVEKPKPPKPAPASATFPRPSGSAHPAAGTLTKWFKDEVVTESQYRQLLEDLGYAREDIDRFVLDNAPASNGQA